MLLGTGVDIIRVSRIQHTIDRFGERFLARVFTPAELAYCRRKRNPTPSLAVRFAAKEACFKAMGGTRRPAWRDIEVHNTPTGKPAIRLHGRMAAACPGLHTVLALSHDGDLAIATVVAELLPPSAPALGAEEIAAHSSLDEPLLPKPVNDGEGEGKGEKS